MRAAKNEVGQQRSQWRRHLLLLGIITLITVLHYVTPVSQPLWHHIYRRLYYLPVLGGAYWFSLRGGLGYALLVSSLYLPHAILHWTMISDQFDQVAEMAMFVVIGGLVGGMLSVIRRHQATLRRQERLALLGRMAAGVAHEVRNPLAGMRGATGLLGGMAGMPAAAGEFIAIIDREIGRLERMVTDFVAFSRPAPLRLGPVAIGDVVQGALRLVAADARRKNIEFRVMAGPAAPALTGDAQQLAQVVLNLLLNAAQAMPDGGIVTVTIDATGDAIAVTVADAGKGLAGVDARQLFEPFYTTRADGSGLGLSLAREIARAHGGDLTLAGRADGPGAVACLTLPRRAAAGGEEVQ